MSPPNDDTPYDRYAIAGGYFNSLVGNSYMPSNISKYEEEVYNAFNKQYGGGTSTRAATNNIWPSQQHQQQQNYYGGIAKERPERFEVYKTMAERASEFGRNDLTQYQHRMSAGGSCYYPGERPLSSYAGGSIGLRSGPRTEEYGGMGGGGGGIRRSIYETERPITPCNEYISGNYYSHNQPLPEPESPPRGGEGRFRRKIAALRDADGRRSSYASRSQSNDHMALLSRGAYMPDELEQIEPISGNSRYATPEIGGGVGGGGGGYSNQLPEYAYIAYHDSGMPNGGGGQQYINSRSSRRDQHNVDLDAAPIRGILKNRQAYEGEPRVQANREYDYDVNLNNKKRGSAGLLNLGRRKTTEVRLGPESVPNSRKQSANILLEEEFKRPRSPIECIKSLFRGGNQKITGKDNLNSVGGGPSSRYSTNIGANNNGNGGNYGYTTSGGGGGNNNYINKRYGVGGGGGGGRSDGGRFTSTNNYNGGNRTNAPNRWGYEDTHL